VHIPFCESVCYYCACNKVVTRDHTRSGPYLDALEREIALHVAVIGARQPVSQLHLGGGTPTFFNDAELSRLMQMLRGAFSIQTSAELSIEVDPRTADPQRLRHLAELGFNRLSFGAQDFDPTVQRAVHRVQSEESVRELLVVSQDTSAYGVDLKYAPRDWNGKSYQTRMKDLCEGLSELGIWTRLHYVYPYPHVDDIIPLMADGKLLPYLDIPFQHASPRILKLMKRPGAVDKTLERIQRWRAICPDITIRSTFIVGFPGETDEDFEQLLSFLDMAELDRVGAFAYSPVDGARANELPDAVPEAVKQERLARFMELQAQISAEKLERKVGTVQTVIIDEIDGELAIGRSKADAPEIDGLVQIQDGAAAGLKPGDFCEVRIMGSDEHDLFGLVGPDQD